MAQIIDIHLETLTTTIHHRLWELWDHRYPIIAIVDFATNVR